MMMLLMMFQYLSKKLLVFMFCPVAITDDEVIGDDVVRGDVVDDGYNGVVGIGAVSDVVAIPSDDVVCSNVFSCGYVVVGDDVDRGGVIVSGDVALDDNVVVSDYDLGDDVEDGSGVVIGEVFDSSDVFSRC